MNKLILVFVLFSYTSTFANQKDTTDKTLNNKIYFSYAPSFTNDAKKPFHGVEITYERNIKKWFAISFTQGFYTTKKENSTWINSSLDLIPITRQQYYFNSYATLQFIPYSNSFYELKLGTGASLYYRYVIKDVGTDKNFPYKNVSYDKGVLGGIHFNLENNFYIKKHILLGVKFEPQLIFPKKNVGDKIIILRPAINIGYRF